MTSGTAAAAVYIVLIGAVTVGGAVALAEIDGDVSADVEPGQNQQLNETAVEQAMHSELNNLRAEHGLPPATYNEQVSPQATVWSQRMVNGTYEHSPQGYYACPGGMAENIATLPAYGAVELDTGEVVRYGGNETRLGHALVGVWNRSPPHRSNILDATHTSHAPGIAVGERNGTTTLYATSAFCAAT